MDTVKIVCALAMSAAMAVRAESTSLTAGNARFTLLAPRMVRCEWSADGVFEDRPSLVFADRDQPSVPFEHSIRGDGVQPA